MNERRKSGLSMLLDVVTCARKHVHLPHRGHDIIVRLFYSLVHLPPLDEKVAASTIAFNISNTG